MASFEKNRSSHISNTIEDILKLESFDRTAAEQIADGVAAFTGSIFFIWLHIIWFASWLILNIPWWGFAPFDPFPFTFLTMVVSLEAIFLSAFILMAENRQGRLADRRARVDLQVNMIAEREITKLLEMVADIHSHLGIQKPRDAELDKMQSPTDIEHLTLAAQAVEEQDNGKSSLTSPRLRR
jgi:uncharacterized membrane protein